MIFVNFISMSKLSDCKCDKNLKKKFVFTSNRKCLFYTLEFNCKHHEALSCKAWLVEFLTWFVWRHRHRQVIEPHENIVFVLSILNFLNLLIVKIIIIISCSSC